MRTGDRQHRLEALALGALVALGAADASAQADFFRVAPGPLSAAHERWDNSDGCSKCHKLGEGVTNLLCLDCHDHEPLKAAIFRNEGLHARFKDPCIRCHPEHKGRSAAIDKWDLLGGRSSFDHAKTGFALTFKHAKVPCTACHKRTLSSGRTSYVGLKTACIDCHKNPHAFTTAEIAAHKCEECHKGGAIDKIRGSDVPFDHGKATGVLLVGPHAKALCVACHKGGKMANVGEPRTCKDCHKSPHGPNFAENKPCGRCHSPERSFKRPSFDHDSTQFPLRGQHAKEPCEHCHKNPKVKPQKTCMPCHTDNHKGRFEKRICEDCHAPGDLTRMHFDHNKLTKFPLTGLHAQQKCRECHRGTKPFEWEKLESTECQSCHRHQNAHKGQFKDKKCAACHEKGGSLTLVFDHQKDARFKLVGLHLKLSVAEQCKKCHPDKRYRTNKLRCVECHKDSHKGTLGDKCDKCHNNEVKFAKIVFDHTASSRFPLLGKHLKVKCEKCHPQKAYKLKDIRCIACHAKTEPHTQKLGDACDRCHTPDPGATKFDHDRMTKFPRAGKHKDTPCPLCHRKVEPGTPPPPVGWAKNVVLPEKVDRQFPLMGHRCADCHRDHHEGRYGAACDSCHKPTSFKDVSRAVHDTGSMRLYGAHDRTACSRCHGDGRLLTGLGDLCQECHYDDDAHHAALGPTCGDCHTQHDWLPATFSHTETGFALSGAHRLAPCSACHGLGTYAGVPTECGPCHARQALTVRDPIHTAELSRCEDCHSQATFLPARAHHPTYPLAGIHVTLRCRDCHGAGSYAGTPRECAGCHLQAYLSPSTVPNHSALGFSLDCGSCHTQVSWIPAHAPN
ncbi:MAG: hypothetical protein HY903_02960 [Deltaproteobacteria bacterium]|nr:hypothetical protein [Deltaproteobacteria bacterium]